MLEELEPNLHEHILTRLVDYGHTFSMDIEMAGLADGARRGIGRVESFSLSLFVQDVLLAAAICAAWKLSLLACWCLHHALRIPAWAYQSLGEHALM